MFDPSLLDSAALAHALGVARKTVYNWRSAGLIVPALMIRKRPLYDIDDCISRLSDLGSRDSGS